MKQPTIINDFPGQRVEEYRQVHNGSLPNGLEPEKWDRMLELLPADKKELTLAGNLVRELVLDYQRAARAATERPAEELRNMDSAPKDGTPFLGWLPTYYQGKGAWGVVLMLHGDWMDNRAWKVEPGGWIPLPALPSSGPHSP